jgi:hypothetical protein
MIRYATVTPAPECRRIGCLAVELASMKLGVEPVPLIFIREDPEGGIEKPFRIRGATDADGQGNVCILLNVDQSPERLVRTSFHEMWHVRALRDYILGDPNPAADIGEGLAEFFAASESPRGNSRALMAALWCYGAETALELNLPGTAGVCAEKLREFDVALCESLKGRVEDLVFFNETRSDLFDGLIPPSSPEARTAEINRQWRRHWELKRRQQDAERLRQEVASVGERVRAAAAKAAAAAAKKARDEESFPWATRTDHPRRESTGGNSTAGASPPTGVAWSGPGSES